MYLTAEVESIILLLDDPGEQGSLLLHMPKLGIGWLMIDAGVLFLLQNVWWRCANHWSQSRLLWIGHSSESFVFSWDSGRLETNKSDKERVGFCHCFRASTCSANIIDSTASRRFPFSKTIEVSLYRNWSRHFIRSVLSSKSLDPSLCLWHRWQPNSQQEWVPANRTIHWWWSWCYKIRVVIVWHTKTSCHRRACYGISTLILCTQAVAQTSNTIVFCTAI